MIILFLGPPASGKGTQAKLLAEALNIPYVSVGACLRQAAATNQIIASVIDRGDFVPFRYFSQIMDDVHARYGDDLILDGALRSPEQVEYVLTLWGTRNPLVLLLEIPDTLILKRAIKRSLERDPRHDDNEQVVKNRITLYRQSLPNILEKLNQSNIPVIELDGQKDIETVHRIILRKIREFTNED